MKATELKTVLDSHAAWLRGESHGARANLSGADLSWANLSGADLSRANLYGANLSRADLSWANLSGADLSRANLSGADLSRANLYGADLSRANLSRANLSGADLSRANLYGANLSRANLSGADLSRANLSGANLYGATLPPLSILPDGELIGWKKLSNGTIAKLKIPADAPRVNSTGRKCRAAWVEVLQGQGKSSHDNVTEYAPGLVVRPDSYDPDFRVECSHGIHFFITRAEAEAY
jgi:hypothetical protein